MPKKSSSRPPPKKSKVKKDPIDHARRQVAALPWRKAEDRVEVCLVTTRETRRWTVPKGWPMKRLTKRAAARAEAEQEAGVTGAIGKTPIGFFSYWKRRPDRFDFVRVEVFALRVTAQLEAWKEKGEREIRWMRPADAALLVEEPALSSLLAGFRPAGA